MSQLQLHSNGVCMGWQPLNTHASFCNSVAHMSAVYTAADGDPVCAVQPGISMLHYKVNAFIRLGDSMVTATTATHWDPRPKPKGC